MTKAPKTQRIQSTASKWVGFAKRHKTALFVGACVSIMIIIYADGYLNRPSSENGTVGIVGNNINCRSEPNVNGKVARQISGYAEFKLIKAEKDWVQIEADDQACWTSATYVVLNANLRAGDGELPRIVEYLKNPVADRAISSTSSAPKSINNQSLSRSIAGIWGLDVDECSGSDTALEFQHNGVFSGFGLGNARWVEDRKGVLIRWGRYEGDDMNDPHDAGQSLGIIKWLAPDHISISWQPYGAQNWGTETLIRCP